MKKFVASLSVALPLMARMGNAKAGHFQMLRKLVQEIVQGATWPKGCELLRIQPSGTPYLDKRGQDRLW